MLPQGTSVASQPYQVFFKNLRFCSAENADRKLFRSADLPAAAPHFPRSTLRKTRTSAPHFFIVSALSFYNTPPLYKHHGKGIIKNLSYNWREGAKRGFKMTLTVDAAGAAFDSSTTTVSVKRLAALLTTLL